MWLVPALHGFSRFLVRTYYRFEVQGSTIPSSGPVVVVANHPNGVVDPGCVIVAAGRPIRFLAKAPLFDDLILGPIVRGSGAIPVRRRQDESGAEIDNSGMFAAAREALASGSAVGIFPEGISHDEPSMTPLKTGAARIVLGSAAEGTRGIRILPVGLNYRAKQTFRSRALALVGDDVEWSDLEGRPECGEGAVRELTARIQRAIRDVTVNLERWEDAALIEHAEAIWSAEFGRLDADERQEGRIAAGSILARLRQNDPESVEALTESILSYAQTLDLLQLRPRQLDTTPSILGALRWAARRLSILVAGVPVIGAGVAVFALPYLLVAFLDRRSDNPRDIRSTYKLFGGGLLYVVWIALLAVLVGWRYGLVAASITAATLPLLGMATQWLRERWGYAQRDVSRFFALRQASLRERLLARRKALAMEIDALVEKASRP
ncbi:MAG: lysophospholipid acyltransferase family protein [Thermoanaerobaculia bacterium]